MQETIPGARIRAHRRQLGLTQTELAKQIGISTSYLNLIERNKRRIAGDLLRRTASVLGIGADELDGAAERRLAGRLREVASLPHLSAFQAEEAAVPDLIGRFPGWANAITALVESERNAVSTARALGDRLTHDPFLGEALHGMLSRISALRSAAEILTDFDDIPETRRARFLSIIRDESRMLSGVGEALAAYFDKAGDIGQPITPADEVEALFHKRQNRMEEIEELAESLSLRVEPGAAAFRTDAAHRLAQAEFNSVIESIVAEAPELETAAGRDRAKPVLFEYAADALLAPMKRFEERARTGRYDAELLANQFAAPYQVICRRLAALPSAAGAPSFAYFQANAAGTIIQQRGEIVDLPLPRYSSACPLWVLYRAQQRPQELFPQRVRLPGGGRHLFLARARNNGGAGFGAPRHYLTDMLAIGEAHAANTVYASLTDLVVEDIGPACRICPRTGCVHRVDDPLVK